MALDLSEVAGDPDLGDEFFILRSTGQFGQGGWQILNVARIFAFGVIAIAEPDALQMVPEGDRVTGALQVICPQQLYPTQESRSGTSDQIEWNGSKYRVQAPSPWKKNGFCSAILLRMKGD